MSGLSEIEAMIEKYALQNAVRYEGKANPGSVIGQIIREKPELKSSMKEIQLLAAKAVERINKLPLDEQRAQLETLAPELLEKREHKEHDLFASLGIKKDEEIITSFPPEPSKYPHIGHVKACIVNYELAKRTGGKFRPRFDDTNPSLAKQEFYDIIQENLAWLGIDWERFDIASDHMKEITALADKLIAQGHCFVDDTPSEVVNSQRYNSEPSANRNQSVEETTKRWTQMKEGEVLRLKIDFAHKNTTMRDPSIFRIMSEEHVRAKGYTKWPTYDFETAVMDAIQGITFRLRSKEFELRTELHQHIQKICGFKTTRYYEFARFNLQGVETQGRVIREKIQSGEFLGWDDPRLATIVALRRRGFTPSAIKSFILSTGITKNESTLTWDDLYVHNRRVLNETAKRLFFIDEPIEIEIKGAKEKEVMLSFFPHNKQNDRPFITQTFFSITRDDFESLKEGELYRLMDAFNFIKKENDFVYEGESLDDYRAKGKKILHYIPKNHDSVKVEVLMPDLSVKQGLGESRISSLAIGDIIQFERFGFCRLDSVERQGQNKIYKFWFTHK